MKKVSNLFLSLLVLLFIGQQNLVSNDNAQSYLEQKGEVYFSFSLPDKKIFSELLNTISVDNIADNIVYAYANSDKFEDFLGYNISYKVLKHPGNVDFDLNMKTSKDLFKKDYPDEWDFYPTYEAYVDLMYQFEADYPDLVQIINIGQTVMGRDMLFAKISPDVNSQRPVPQFMYTSTMHGDETGGFILSLRLIHYLISNYGVNDEVTALMDNVDIWICPNENPDGTYTNDNSTVNGATRGNANGVDLNRNYPNPVSQHDVQEIETVNMINFTDTINFIMSANMHAGVELVNFPFDSWISNVRKHADHNWWEFVMNEYVDTVYHYSIPGYMTNQGGVTHGGDWYVIDGSRQDFFNYYRSCREFTLELSTQKILEPELLPDLWEYNYRSLLNYIKQAKYGVHGLVYDKDTEEPLIADIVIEGYDEYYSQIKTSLPFGNFNRPLLEGTYDIIFSSEGYITKRINDIEVTNHNTTFLEVELEPIYELPEIAVYPETLQFGEQYINSEYSYNVTIENTGSDTLEIYSINIQGDDVFYTEQSVKLSEFEIPPGESEIIEVYFYPQAQMEYSATMIIESNDDSNPEVEVSLTGEGKSRFSVSIYESGKEDLFLEVYPNPVTIYSKLEVKNKNYKHLTINIYDIQGNKVSEIFSGGLSAGNHHFPLQEHYKSLEKGAYFIALNNIKSIKILVVK